jgi:hypothetical protein
VAKVSRPFAAGTSGMVLPPGMHLAAAFPEGGWGSLFIEADAIRVHADAAHATLRQAAAGSPAVLQLPPGAVPAGTLQPTSPDVPAASASFGLGDAPQGTAFWLEASGVRRLEWYNATVSCSSAACPDAPAYQPHALPLRGGDRAEVRNYTELATWGGHATASGHALLAAVGGGHLDGTLDGSLRLPGAHLGACAPDCPGTEGGTLRAEGNLTLSGLEPQPGHGDRLRGQLGGTVLHTMLDESERPDLLRVSAVAGGAALGLALLAKLLAALLWRRQRQAPKDHPRRQALQQIVAREPGLTFRQLQRRAGWGNGVTRHHLDHLVQASRIVARPYRNTVRYFENHGRYDAGWQQVVQWRDEEQRWLRDWLAQRPGGVGQAEVVRVASAARGWSRSATQRRLKALVDAGLVRAETRGRAQVYVAQALPMGLAVPDGSTGRAGAHGTPVPV